MRARLLPAGLAWFVPALGLAAAGGAAERQRAVEGGLLPAVVIEGQPAATRQLRARMQALHVPGVAIAVLRHGQIDWIQGYGVRGPDGMEVDARTLFQAGSVSKPVAAAVALALVQDGKLPLDAPVNSVLRSWRLPDNDWTRTSPVTLRRLLSHTAGTTVHGFQGYAADAPLPTLPQVLDGQPPANSAPVRVDHPVGMEYRYSGGGYSIVQQMIADATGESFPVVSDRTLLAPLGMARSSFKQPLPAGTANVALPHDENGQPVAGGPHVYPEMAAAGLWTTAEDLVRFVIEIQRSAAGQGHALTAATARAMLTPGLGSWSLGFKITDPAGSLAFYHDGANAGYKATLVGHPGSGDGAVILTNGDQGYQLGQEILRAIALTYGWKDYRPVERRAIALSPQDRRRFAGVFGITGLGEFEIHETGEALELEIRKGQVLRLTPSTERTFFATEQDIVASFDDADHGTLAADGLQFAFERVKTP